MPLPSFTKFLIFVAVLSVSVAAAITIAARSSLQERAISKIDSRLHHHLRGKIASIENSLDDLAETLRETMRAGQGNCTELNFERLVIARALAPAVERISIVKPDGTRLCSLPQRELAGRKLLPAIDPSAPALTFDYDEELNAQFIIMSGRQPNGNRIAYEIAAWKLATNFAARNISPIRTEIHFTPSSAAKPATDEAPPPTGAELERTPTSQKPWIRLSNASQIYPFHLELSVPPQWVEEEVRPARTIITTAAIGFALLIALMLILFWFFYARNSTPAGFDSELARCISQGHIAPLYQPLIGIEDGKIAGCELKIGWRREDGHIIGSQYLPAYAEISGKMHRLMLAALNESLSEMAEFYSTQSKLKLIISLTAQEIQIAGIVEDFLDVIDKSPIGHQQIIYKIAGIDENINRDALQPLLNKLQIAAARIMIGGPQLLARQVDDACSFGFDYLEITRAAIPQDAMAQGEYKPHLDTAQSKGIGTIATDADSRSRLALYRRLGVKTISGNCLAEPLDGKHFMELANRSSSGQSAAAMQLDSADNAADEIDMAQALI